MANLADSFSPESLQGTVQTILKNVDGLFDQFQAMHISLTNLLVGAMICVIVLLFAIREAAAWFFKVDGVRRDLRRLQATTSQIENEVRAVKELMTQLNGPLRDCLNEKIRDSQSSEKPIAPNTTPKDVKAEVKSESKAQMESMSTTRPRTQVFEPITPPGTPDPQSTKQFPIQH